MWLKSPDANLPGSNLDPLFYLTDLRGFPEKKRNYLRARNLDVNRVQRGMEDFPEFYQDMVDVCCKIAKRRIDFLLARQNAHQPEMAFANNAIAQLRFVHELVRMEGLDEDWVNDFLCDYVLNTHNYSYDADFYPRAQELVKTINQAGFELPELMTWYLPNIPYAEVHRTRDIVVFGDLNGNIETFGALMKATDPVLAEETEEGKWIWTGGAVELVLTGDILGDRHGQGVQIMQILSELRPQIEAAGGRLTVLIGNHDHAYVAFLLDWLVKGYAPGDAYKHYQKYLNDGPKKGLKYAHPGDLDVGTIPFMTPRCAFESRGNKLYPGDGESVRTGMIFSHQGALDEIRRMKMFHRVDDGMISHTPFVSSEDFQYVHPRLVNSVMREALAYRRNRSNYLAQVNDRFLNPNRRGWDSTLNSSGHPLQRVGVNWYLCGHQNFGMTRKQLQKQRENGGVIHMSADMNLGQTAEKIEADDLRSLIVIRKNGAIEVGGKELFGAGRVIRPAFGAPRVEPDDAS